jgi:hypothetical protein
MTLTTLPKLDFKVPLPQNPSAKPGETPAACQQEQFTGPLPARSERPMAEILAERLAKADPDSPTPVFIP